MRTIFAIALFWSFPTHAAARDALAARDRDPCPAQIAVAGTFEQERRHTLLKKADVRGPIAVTPRDAESE